jgi:tryptophan 2,3-dioxygenase
VTALAPGPGQRLHRRDGPTDVRRRDVRDDMTYGEYLALDELLSLQRVRSGAEHDELLFIVIHQVYELWFKQLLHELDQGVRWLDDDELGRAGHQLARCLKILKTMVGQLDVLETMTPLEFLSFRDFLGTSSGFQSVQFRELEFLLGRKRRQHLDRFADDPAAHGRLAARHRAPSLWAHVLRLLDRRGHDVPTAVLERDPELATEPDEGVQDALVVVYREDPALAELCERLTDLDEGLQEWRYRHVMMVMRTIGTKQGTGGSAGAGYLRTTLFEPVFPDLWAIRTRL